MTCSLPPSRYNCHIVILSQRRGATGGLVKVLLVDDDAVVRQSVKLVLADVTQRVTEAASGHEALRLALSETWDVVVLDMVMPDANGIAVLSVLQRERPDLPVLIVSLYSDPYYVRGALRAGAAGYVRKEAAGDELVPALHSVLSGTRYLSPALMSGPSALDA